MNHLRGEMVGNGDESDSQRQPEAALQSPRAAASELTCVPNGENSTLRSVLAEAEVQAILQALKHTGWNRKRAAGLLKISYRGLLYKIRHHNITPA